MFTQTEFVKMQNTYNRIKCCGFCNVTVYLSENISNYSHLSQGVKKYTFYFNVMQEHHALQVIMHIEVMTYSFFIKGQVQVLQ